MLVSLIYIPNPIYERLENLQNIDFNDPIIIPNTSLRERLFYLYYGYGELNNNFLLGIGPQNLESRMSNYLISNDINSITPRDHLHNDFLDIAVKFGTPAFILLISLYLFILKSYQFKFRNLGFIIMIMLLSSQLTQSQFAHNQAITFFIVLLYIVINLKTDNVNKTNLKSNV